MHPALKQLLINKPEGLEPQALLHAQWTLDKSFITKMWSHPKFARTVESTRLFQITSAWDHIWKMSFGNTELRIPEDHLVKGSLSSYLSTFDAAVLLHQVGDRRDTMRAECLAISFDGFDTYYENELLNG